MKITEWRGRKAKRMLALDNDIDPDLAEATAFGLSDVTSMLADLRHYCHMAELDFWEASDDSYEIYLTELGSDEEV